MTSFKEVVANNVALVAELSANRGKISDSLRARILAHIDVIKSELGGHIEAISDMADNPAVWRAKKDSLLPKLQRERSQLVELLSGWEGFGF
ncbi:hypothetical protein HY483_03105 [Candidatus Woesearchaeota archaeon]|nr:hypothetical protein [Candidatus Woesearchaeota archaeon]